MAGDEIEVVIEKVGLACENRVAEQFDVPNLGITVRLGATPSRTSTPAHRPQRT